MFCNRAYMEFLINKEYMSLGERNLIGDPDELYSPTGYAILDINQDGKEELLIECQSNIGDAFRVLYVFTYNGSNVQLADSRMCYQHIAYSAEYKAVAAAAERPSVSLVNSNSDQRECFIHFSSFDGEKFYPNFSLWIDDYDEFMYGEVDEAEYEIWYESEIIQFRALP